MTEPETNGAVATPKKAKLNPGKVAIQIGRVQAALAKTPPDTKFVAEKLEDILEDCRQALGLS